MTTDHPPRRRFAYDAWANREAYHSLAQATVPLPARATAILSHIVASQRAWLGRIAPESQSAAVLPVWPDLDLAACDRQLADLAKVWPAILAENPSDRLDRAVTYTNLRGEAHTSLVGDILDHVLAHGAYHRGQVTTLLGRADGSAAVTDFIWWVRLGEPAGG